MADFRSVGEGDPVDGLYGQRRGEVDGAAAVVLDGRRRSESPSRSWRDLVEVTVPFRSVREARR